MMVNTRLKSSFNSGRPGRNQRSKHVLKHHLSCYQLSNKDTNLTVLDQLTGPSSTATRASP